MSVTEYNLDVTISVTEYSPKSISVCDRTQCWRNIVTEYSLKSISVCDTGHSAEITMSVTEYSPKSISVCDRTQCWRNTVCNRIQSQERQCLWQETVRENQQRQRQRHSNKVCERTQHLHNENVCVKAQFDVANLLNVYVLPLSLQWNIALVYVCYVIWTAFGKAASAYSKSLILKELKFLRHVSRI